jgi:hypothetical protein
MRQTKFPASQGETKNDGADGSPGDHSMKLQGSMLWSQFSAIFGEKIGVFSQKRCYYQDCE